MIVIWNDPEEMMYQSNEIPAMQGSLFSVSEHEEIEREVNPIGFIWNKEEDVCK